MLLVASEAFSYSATNYWTITLLTAKDGEVYGRVIGSFALSARSLAAGVPVTVYSSTVGLAMTDGERLRAHVVSTGSPAALVDAVLFAEVQRNAR